MAKEDYMSFEDVLQELNLQEEDLQKLVSDLKLRAFRVRNTLKFRRTDVMQLKDERQKDVTLILPDQESEPPTSKLSDKSDSGLVLPDTGEETGPTLLEVPPAGDTQELRAMPGPGAGAGATAAPETFGIEPAPQAADEDEIGTELDFREIPLSDTQELPSTATGASQDQTDTDLNQDEIGTELNFGELPLGDTQELASASAQDSTDKDINLEALQGPTAAADDMTDTVIPTIELTEEGDVDDTTDTVIPTIELTTDEDLTDDTSDTVIPTIELSDESELESSATETAFPTIELAEDEEELTAEFGGTTGLATESAGTEEPTADLGLTDDSTGLDLTATEQEDLPTFDESPGVDTQQETSAIESDLNFATSGEAATDAETGALDEEPAREIGWELGVEAAPPEAAPPVVIGFGTVVALVLTIIPLIICIPILRSAIDLNSERFSTPEYLGGIVDIARSLRDWLASVINPS